MSDLGMDDGGIPASQPREEDSNAARSSQSSWDPMASESAAPEQIKLLQCNPAKLN